MGRQDYSQIGYGYTLEEARQNAIAEARDVYGHQEGYSGAMNCSTSENKPQCLEQPIRAKTCKIEKNVQKGARQWETVFIIEPVWSPDFRNRVELRNSTQGKAIAEAKKLALKNQSEYVIRIDKRLVKGKDTVATVKPNKSQRGKWLFTGMARC